MCTLQNNAVCPGRTVRTCASRLSLGPHRTSRPNSRLYLTSCDSVCAAIKHQTQVAFFVHGCRFELVEADFVENLEDRIEMVAHHRHSPCKRILVLVTSIQVRLRTASLFIVSDVFTPVMCRQSHAVGIRARPMPQPKSRILICSMVSMCKNLPHSPSVSTTVTGQSCCADDRGIGLDG